MDDQPLMDETLQPVAVAGDTSEVPRYFSLSQRIGRLRYFVYMLSGLVCASFAILLIYMFCLTLPPDLARLIYGVSNVLIKNILMPMIVFVMTIRRLHDVDFKGWWALLVIVPFLASILLLVPGSSGNNRFGPPPRANSVSVKLAAILLPLFLFILFFAFKDAPPRGGRPPADNGGQLKSYAQ